MITSTEGFEQFQALLARADDTVASAVRAKAALGAGRLSWCQDRDTDALRYYREAQSLYQSLGMEEQVGVIEAHIGFTGRNDGNNQAARAHFDRAKTIGEKQRSERVLAMAVNGLGSLAADGGDFVTAREAKERSLVSFRSLGDQWVVALVTGSLGKCSKHFVAMSSYTSLCFANSSAMRMRFSEYMAIQAVPPA